MNSDIPQTAPNNQIPDTPNSPQISPNSSGSEQIISQSIETNAPARRRKKKDPPPIDETVAEEHNIKDGINDLSNLPIKLLQLELISRGYHEGVIMRLDKQCLTNILRDSTNLYSYIDSSRSTKLFTEDAETETKRLTEQIEKSKGNSEEGNFDITKYNFY